MSRATTARPGLAGDLVVYSVEDAARLLGISRTKAYAAVRDGTLKTIATGRRQVVPAAAIEALLWTALSNRPPFLPPRADDLDHNRVEVSGRLTRDAEARRTGDGRSFTTLRLAVRRGRGQQAVFIDVAAFGALADEASTLRKGTSVQLTGRLDQREWTAADGSHHEGHRIFAESIDVPDLDKPAQRGGQEGIPSTLAGTLAESAEAG